MNPKHQNVYEKRFAIPIVANTFHKDSHPRISIADSVLGYMLYLKQALSQPIPKPHVFGLVERADILMRIGNYSQSRACKKRFTSMRAISQHLKITAARHFVNFINYGNHDKETRLRVFKSCTLKLSKVVFRDYFLIPSHS